MTDTTDPYDIAHIRTKSIRLALDLLPDLKAAYKEKDWLPAGYEDWQTYVTEEYRLDKLDTSDKLIAAKFLKTTKIDPISITNILGIELSEGTPRKVLNSMARRKLGKFQVIRPLTAEELKSLEASVKEHGVLEPITLDEDGNILDGHHRKFVADKLGIEYPTRVLEGLDEDGKVAVAKELNYNRRQLSQDEKRQLVIDELIASPKTSNRVIARLVGVSEGTVRNVRKELESSAQIAHEKTTVGADGRETKKPERKPKAKKDTAEEPEDTEDEDTGSEDGTATGILSALGNLHEAGRQIEKATKYLDPELCEAVGLPTLVALLEGVTNAVVSMVPPVEPQSEDDPAEESAEAVDDAAVAVS